MPCLRTEAWRRGVGCHRQGSEDAWWRSKCKRDIFLIHVYTRSVFTHSCTTLTVNRLKILHEGAHFLQLIMWISLKEGNCYIWQSQMFVLAGCGCVRDVTKYKHFIQMEPITRRKWIRNWYKLSVEYLFFCCCFCFFKKALKYFLQDETKTSHVGFLLYCWVLMDSVKKLMWRLPGFS